MAKIAKPGPHANSGNAVRTEPRFGGAPSLVTKQARHALGMVDAPLFNQSGAMRATAARYLKRSRDTKDRRERGKFLDYAVAYARLAQQLKLREASWAMARGNMERADASNRGDGLARSHGP